MILAKYEDFLVDKCRFIATLAKQLEIPEKCDISDKVNIQYLPRGNHSVSWKDFYGMENLMLIEQICGIRMKEFGYNKCNDSMHE